MNKRGEFQVENLAVAVLAGAFITVITGNKIAIVIAFIIGLIMSFFGKSL